jgi:hypothetical protein
MRAATCAALQQRVTALQGCSCMWQTEHGNQVARLDCTFKQQLTSTGVRRARQPNPHLDVSQVSSKQLTGLLLPGHCGTLGVGVQPEGAHTASGCRILAGGCTHWV